MAGIGLTVAFVVGTTLLAVSAGAQLTDRAGKTTSDLRVAVFDAPATAREASATGVVFPTATLELDERTVTVLGVPPASTTVRLDGALALPPPPPASTLRLPRPERASDLVPGSLTVEQRVDSAFVPSSWGVAAADTVERLGTDGALLVGSDSISDTRPSVPLVGIRPFFRRATAQVSTLLLAATAGASVLVGVVVFVVTRMTLRDRRETIHLLRATGAPPRRILWLVVARASLLTGVGLLLGVSLGVVATNAATNAAVFAGVPTTLDPAVDFDVLARLAPTVAALLITGLGAGILAGWNASTRPPARALSRPSTPGSGSRVAQRFPDRICSGLALRVLSWRTVVPTAATVTVFVVFVLVIAGLAGAVAPLATADEGTVVEDGAPHPMASQVGTDLAAALRAEGVPASPEIFLFETYSGQPLLARGVNYTAFARLSDARIVRGRPPRGPAEAVVGADLAGTLGVRVGETVWLGGSNRPGVAPVRVVGTYRASGMLGDQLLISLDRARGLANVGPGEAHVIRVGSSVGTSGDGEPRATATATQGNDSDTRDEAAGTETGDDSLALRWLPRRVPPNATVTVRVIGDGGRPVPNATVTVAGDRFRSGPNGTISLALPGTGTYTLTATHPKLDSVRESVQAVSGAARRPVATVAVEPPQPDVLVRPRAVLEIHNPWEERVETALTVDGPGERRRRTIGLDAGETARQTVRLSRAAPGTHTVTVRTGGESIGSATYRIRGDTRAATAVAASGRLRRGSGLGQSIDHVLGNVRFLLGAVLALAGLTAIGSTTAAFASAVHARRRALGIHRAVGATPWQVTRPVLADALRIGAAGTGLATLTGVAATVVLGQTGAFRAFGVSLSPALSPALLVAVLASGTALAVCGALVAVRALLAASPRALLIERQPRPEGGRAARTSERDDWEGPRRD